MNSQQFIAKQRVKYVWKVLKQSSRPAVRTEFRQIDDATEDDMESFWQYEQTPRSLNI